MIFHSFLGRIRLWIALASLVQPAAASAESCQTLTSPAIKVIVSEGKLDYDFTLSGDQLGKLARSERQTAHSKLGRVRGLTLANLSLSFRNGLTARRLSDGRLCLVLTDVTANLVYVRTTVYVDRKYAKGTCEFNAIMDHENQHVAINRETLKRFAPRLQSALEAAAPAVNPMPALSLETGKKRQMDLLQKEIAPQIDAMNAVRDRANASIDTVQSYRATQEKCRNW